jgi:hypothetical protein
MYVGCNGETCVYACCLIGRGCICGKCVFWLWEVQKWTSSLHRETKRQSDQVSLGEEKFSIIDAP